MSQCQRLFFSLRTSFWIRTRATVTAAYCRLKFRTQFEVMKRLTPKRPALSIGCNTTFPSAVSQTTRPLFSSEGFPIRAVQ